MFCGVSMWAWLDLNQRLSRYEQGVLTFELHAPTLARWESNPPLRIWRPPCYRNTSHQKGDDLLDDPITPSRKPRRAVL